MSSHDSHVLPLLAAALLFFSNIRSVRALYCVDTGRGFQECSVLSPGARIGIGIAIAIAGLLLIFFVGIMRQRRNKRNNMAYVNNNIGMQGSQYAGPPGYYQSQGYAQQYPQYPPPTHNNGWDPNTGFAPPYQTQPPQYTPPPGPPPVLSDKTRPLSGV